MVKVECIDDKNRPPEIPKEKWPVEKKHYHITQVYLHKNQNNIQGVLLKEIALDGSNWPYVSYKMSRFALLDPEDILALAELIVECDELSDIDIEEAEKILEKELVN